METDLALYRALAGEDAAAAERLRRARAVLDRLGRSWATEARRSRDVREGAGSYVPVFPRAEDSGAIALVASRAEIVRAVTLSAQGDPAAAAELANEAVAEILKAGRRTATGPPPDARAEVVALGLLTAVRALRQTGDDGRAQRAAERAAETLSRRFGAQDPRTLRARTTAAALGESEAPRLTAALLSEVVADAEDVEDPAALAYALLERGRALRGAGDADGAGDAFGRVAAMRPTDVGPRTLALALTGLSELALDAGDVEGALDRSADGLRAAQTLPPAVGHSHGVLLSAASAKAAALVAAGREDDAVAVLEPVLRATRSEPSWPALARAQERADRLLDAAYGRL